DSLVVQIHQKDIVRLGHGIAGGNLQQVAEAALALHGNHVDAVFAAQLQFIQRPADQRRVVVQPQGRSRSGSRYSAARSCMLCRSGSLRSVAPRPSQRRPARMWPILGSSIPTPSGGRQKKQKPTSPSPTSSPSTTRLGGVATRATRPLTSLAKLRGNIRRDRAIL